MQKSENVKLVVLGTIEVTGVPANDVDTVVEQVKEVYSEMDPTLCVEKLDYVTKGKILRLTLIRKVIENDSSDTLEVESDGDVDGKED